MGLVTFDDVHLNKLERCHSEVMLDEPIQDHLQTLAAKLRRAMADKRFTVNNLQQRSGLGRTTVSQAINGRRSPTVATVTALAQALGLDPAPLQDLLAQANLVRSDPEGFGYGLTAAEGLTSAEVLSHFLAGVRDLDSASPTAQLAGVLALEWISRQSEKDRQTVVRTLASFVRENAPRPKEAESSGSDQERAQRPPEPVQAALSVIGDLPEGWRQLTRVNLTGTDLRGADLHAAALQNADLSRADLRGADLESACRQVVILGDAKLHGAYIAYADLSGADVRDTDMSGVVGLDEEQVLAARPTRSTVLPKNLVSSPAIAARMERVEEEATWKVESEPF